MSTASVGIRASKPAILPPGIPLGSKTLSSEFLWTASDVNPVSWSVPWVGAYPGNGWFASGVPEAAPAFFILTPEFGVGGWRPDTLSAYLKISAAPPPGQFYLLMQTANETLYSPVIVGGSEAAVIIDGSAMTADLQFIIPVFEFGGIMSSFACMFIGYTGAAPV